MLFSLVDLEEVFDPIILDRGRNLMETGIVERPDVRRDGALVTSFVRSGRGRSHSVYARVIGHGTKPVTVQGDCSCPRRHNCEHVAAVLLRALTDEAQAGASDLARSADSAEGGGTRGSRLNLLYVLYPGDPRSGVEVATVTAARLKAGGYDRLHIYQTNWVSQRQPPQFLTADDLQVLAALASLPEGGLHGRHILEGRLSGKRYKQMLATERCFWGDDQVPLRLTGDRSVQLRWAVDDYGRQHPVFETESADTFVFVLDTLWYLDSCARESGVLVSGLPAQLQAELLDMSGLEPEEVSEWSAHVEECFPDARMPAPSVLAVRALPLRQPIPCLELATIEDGSWLGDVDVALLSFDYEGIRAREPNRDRYRVGDTVLQIERDTRFESNCAELLGFEGLLPYGRRQSVPALAVFGFADDYHACLDFQMDVIPELRRLGWQVTHASNFRLALSVIESWYSEIEPGEEADWFAVSVGVQVDGERINLLPILVKLLEDFPQQFRLDRLRSADPDHQLIIPLPGGQSVPIPVVRIRQILQTLFELYQTEALGECDKLRMSQIQLARLAELDDPANRGAIEWLGGEAMRRLVDRLRTVDGIVEATPPDGLQAKLRDYQIKGLGWLQFLRENDLGGVLADDMGLGKTVQSLAHLLLETEQGRMDIPSLVIAPTTLVFNWRREAQQHAPGLSVLTLHGAHRQKLFDQIPNHDLVLTTYPLLARDHEVLGQHRYHLLILDEAQTIKNPKTHASRIVRQLRARHRLCLTGTPLENHLGELWSLFDFLLPGLLGDEKQFRRLIRNPIEKQLDAEVAGRLARRLRPFMLRRTKGEVVQELPPKTEIVRGIELEGKQRDLYESIRLAVHERVQRAVAEQGWNRSRIVVLDALLKLRQVCCDPRLLKMESARGIEASAKLSLLMDMLPEMIEEGRRILLFSQFTSMLALIQQAVDESSIRYVKLTGQTRDRATPVQQFQDGKVPLFLISLKAGGLGLNLTTADTVIHYDPWWNPAVERQATDRAHRIGQTQPVFVYKLISEGTVEEKIQTLQVHKQALADSLFDDSGAASGTWSEEDLDTLFAPLG